MKEHLRLAWFASWFAFIGQVLVFLCVALFTGEWRYLLWSFLISMTAGRVNGNSSNKKCCGET
ncbi:hypothetical protein LZP85_08715 [Priestia flexa]|uniref:Uncharacterized protein n=2 Tax=Priestia TaxID=2800373 RepID=A0A0V8JQZ6_9BACI|nr:MULTISPECIES: hypothetical protein [Bacillaceae]KSU89476.1 hypothetical protein AS180_02720 [Priestia veravalensis]KZB91232.1 hypothetical protein A2U94_11845 [Bacillus sp. VT 712]MBN8251253.1 hypothetical protein [Priestia flexa]MBN8434484.1 hypothetical protein [Priestia flexa]MCA0966729.1 hypothetical protein [Priestia flexa]